MKRFRFPLDPYLALLRREMEAAEDQSVQLCTKQNAARRHATELLQQRQAALERLSQTKPIAGNELRGLDEWRASLAENSIAAQDAASKLDLPIQQANKHALEIKRRVELLAELRERRLSAHQRLEDRQLEQTVAELYLAGRQRRNT
jgi:hypothetical protein